MFFVCSFAGESAQGGVPEYCLQSDLQVQDQIPWGRFGQLWGNYSLVLDFVGVIARSNTCAPIDATPPYMWFMHGMELI